MCKRYEQPGGGYLYLCKDIIPIRKPRMKKKPSLCWCGSNFVHTIHHFTDDTWEVCCPECGERVTGATEPEAIAEWNLKAKEWKKCEVEE